MDLPRSRLSSCRRESCLIAPDRKSSQDFHLSAHQAEYSAGDERYFVGVNPGKPWKVERNPGQRGRRPGERAHRGASPRGRPPGRPGGRRRSPLTNLRWDRHSGGQRRPPTVPCLAPPSWGGPGARRFGGGIASGHRSAACLGAVFDPLSPAVYNHDVSELIDSVRALSCTANGCD